MSGQVSRGSAGEYQADERAGAARLSWGDFGLRGKVTSLEEENPGVKHKETQQLANF